MTSPARGPHPYPEAEPEAAAVAAELAALLTGWADRARAAGLREMAYLVGLTEAEARRRAAPTTTRQPPGSG